MENRLVFQESNKTKQIQHKYPFKNNKSQGKKKHSQKKKKVLKENNIHLE